LFRFSPSIAETPLATTFPVAETPATFHFLPVAETPITSNPSSVFPMLKHHCSAFFISSHPRHFLTIFIAETTPSSTCLFFSVAETPLSATLHFSHPPSSTKQFNCFASFCC
jgi:hypothetical protein